MKNDMENRVYKFLKWCYDAFPALLLMLCIAGFTAQLVHGSIMGMLFYAVAAAVFGSIARTLD